MKVAIITDQHFGARKNSKLFHDYFLQFYNEVFFPTLEEEGITTVVDMGDTFDSRKGIDFSALAWAKNNYYDRLKELGCTVHTIVGNHTTYYKNTNNLNSVDLLLREYNNVQIYSEATEVLLDKLKVLFIPWINQENEAETLKRIKNASCKCAMGHLELQGFRVNNQIVMEHGLESKLFETFTHVFSGHYHTRSTDGKIFYLGNPYEMYWNDVNDTRGFHIFDTETLEHTPVNNPFKMFHNIYYEDTAYQTFDTRKYEDKIVKVIVRKKTDTKQFEKFIDKLYSSNVAELKVVENFDFSGWYDKDGSTDFESEDTLSILNRYIEESEVDLNKFALQKLLQEIYQEACELV
jgi:DNA repair exonuclease SbcCD nuclease subunit